MKTAKRLFPVLVTLCLCLALLAVPASAASGSCGDNVKWSYSGGTLTISGSGDMTDYWSHSDTPWYDYADDITKVVIKSGVTSIGGDAFFFMDNLTSVTIPNTVTRIGHSAFGGCSKLKSITIPNSVTVIEYCAFLGCDSLTSIKIPEGVTEIDDSTFSMCENLRDVTIPSTVRIIGGGAFDCCTSLTSLVLPEGLETIEDSAFNGCNALTSINIPDSVTFIGEKAFMNCTGLTSFRIPTGLQTLEKQAFQGCLGLRSFTVPSGNQYYSAGPSGELLSKDGATLYQIPCGMTRYTIPASVTTIASRAFYDCSLRELVFPSTVKTIESTDELFYGCDQLESVTLNSAFTTIGQSAFSGCSSLERLTIPSSVTSIGHYAFNYCSGMKTMYIPASVTSIGYNAFDYYTDLEFLCYAGTKAKWNKIDIGDYNYGLEDVTIHYNASKTGHTYTAKVTKPKCLTGGHTTYTCSCGGKYTGKETAPAWHDYQVSSTSGTYVTYTCSRCSDSYSDPFAKSGPMASKNKGWQNYTTYADEVYSYLVQNADGTFTRVEYTGSQVSVEQYDAGLNFKSRYSLREELALFGGYYTDGNYHFLVFGQNNSSENDEKEVLRVVKYDLNWKRLGSASLYGANTVEMFAHGSLRMASCGDYLYVRTAHKMYTYSDGLNHQANLTVNVRISDMTITDDYYTIGDIGFGYVSHSFNQFILVDGDRLLAVDHGDGYPRAISVIRYNAAAGFDEFTNGADYVKILKIYGSTGQNATGASVGGFEASNTHYLVACNSIKQNGSVSTSGQRNIYISATSKTNFTESGTKTIWLTSHSSGVSVSTPHLVKINGNKFCVLWTEGGKLCYAFLNGKGELTSKVYRSSTGSLSDCKPIVVDNRILWYVTNNSAPVFYQIDLNNVSSATVACDHTYIARLSESSSKCACSKCDACYSGSLNLSAGATATFKNVASSASNYQWYYRTSSNGDWIKCTVSGSQSATLKITATTKNSGYQYRCKYRNSSGSTVYTKPMTLYTLGITAQPTAQCAKAGKTATFKVSATGLNKTYQWYYRTSADGEWLQATANGNKTAALKVPAAMAKNGYQYRCKITDHRGNVVYTQAATLYVLGIKTQPSAASVRSGKTATFKVTATGLNKTYQWQYKTATSGWIKCTAAGSKTATLKVDATCAKNGYQYRCKITDAKGNVVYTKAVTLTVFGVKTQPVNRTAAKGTNVTFSVAATGEGLRYQWQYKTSTSGWIKCAAEGNQTATMTVPATMGKNGYQYRCKITDAKGRIVYTDVVTLTVK